MKCLGMTAIPCGLALMLLVGTASAQTSFSENFDDGTFGPNLGITDTVDNTGVPADPSSGAVVLAGGGDGVRSYVGTNDTDYAAADFSASVDVVIASTGGANAFFGLGPGLVGGDGTGGGPSFGEPSVGPTVFGAFNANDRDGGQVNVGDFNTGTTDNITNICCDIGGNPGDGPVVGGGTHTLQLDYAAGTGMLTFSAILNTDGANGGPTPLMIGTVDASDNSFSSSDARIFFGGDGGTVFDNFSVTVIPEPTTLALMGLGLLGSLGVRRRLV